MKRFELNHDVLAEIVAKKAPVNEAEIQNLYEYISSRGKRRLSFANTFHYWFRFRKVINLNKEQQLKVRRSLIFHLTACMILLAILIIAGVITNNYLNKNKDILIKKDIELKEAQVKSFYNLTRMVLNSEQSLAVRGTYDICEILKKNKIKEDTLQNELKNHLWQLYYDSPPLYKSVKPHSGKITHLEFSADGKILLSCDNDGKVFLSDIGEFEITVRDSLEHSESGGTVAGVKFLDKDQLVIIALGNVLHLWKINTPGGNSTRRKSVQLKKCNGIKKFAYSEVADRLLILTDRGIEKMEIDRSDEKPQMKGQEDRPFIEDQKIIDFVYYRDYIITCSTNGIIKLHDFTTGKEVKTIFRSNDSEKNLFDKLIISGNGKYLLAASHESFRSWIWSAEDENYVRLKKRKHTFENEFLNDIKFSPKDDFIITAAQDQLIRVYPFRKVPTVERQEYTKDSAFVFDKKLRKAGHIKPVKLAHPSPDNQIFITSSDDLAIIWDYEGEIYERLTPTGKYITQLAFVPRDAGNNIITAYEDGTIRIWQLRNRNEVRLVPQPIDTLIASHDLKTVLVRYKVEGKKQNLLWYPAKPQDNKLMKEDIDVINYADWFNLSEDENTLLVRDGRGARPHKNKLYAIDLAEGSYKTLENKNNTEVMYIGRTRIKEKYLTFAVFKNNFIQLYDEQFKPIIGKKAPDDVEGITDINDVVHFYKDYLLHIYTSRKDGSIQEWQVKFNENGDPLLTEPSLLLELNSDDNILQISENGEYLISVANEKHEVSLIQLEGCQNIQLPITINNVQSVQFFHNDEYLVLASTADKSAQILKIDKNKNGELEPVHITDIKDIASPVNAAFFASPAGKEYIYTLNKKNEIVQWYFQPDDVYQAIAKLDLDSLTDKERERLGIKSLEEILKE